MVDVVPSILMGQLQMVLDEMLKVLVVPRLKLIDWYGVCVVVSLMAFVLCVRVLLWRNVLARNLIFRTKHFHSTASVERSVRWERTYALESFPNGNATLLSAISSLSSRSSRTPRSSGPSGAPISPVSPVPSVPPALQRPRWDGGRGPADVALSDEPIRSGRLSRAATLQRPVPGRSGPGLRSPGRATTAALRQQHGPVAIPKPLRLEPHTELVHALSAAAVAAGLRVPSPLEGQRPESAAAGAAAGARLTVPRSRPRPWPGSRSGAGRRSRLVAETAPLPQAPLAAQNGVRRCGRRGRFVGAAQSRSTAKLPHGSAARRPPPFGHGSATVDGAAAQHAAGQQSPITKQPSARRFRTNAASQFHLEFPFSIGWRHDGQRYNHYRSSQSKYSRHCGLQWFSYFRCYHRTWRNANRWRFPTVDAI